MHYNNNNSINLISILGTRKEAFTQALNNKLTSAFGPWHVHIPKDGDRFRMTKPLLGYNLADPFVNHVINRKFIEVEKQIKQGKIRHGENSTNNALKAFRSLKPRLLSMVTLPDNLCGCINSLKVVMASIYYAEHITNNQGNKLLVSHSYFMSIISHNLAVAYLPCKEQREELQNGICFGLTSTFINAVFVNDLSKFVQRLKVLGSAKNNWFFMGQKFDYLS